MDDIEKTVALGPEGSGSDTGFGKCPVCGGAFEPDPEHPDRLRCSACRFSQQQPEQIAPGRVVGGKFRVLSPLGSGGNGDLFFCHPVGDSGLRYVLKVMKGASPVAQKRFRREAQILAAVRNNTRIARVIDYGELGSGIYIVMEYVNGKNLRQIRKEYDCDEYFALQIARETALALKDIWEECEVVHRDVKPENIMVDENFRLKLLDFGLSKSWGGVVGESDITMEHSALGTPGYMSPEQFLDFKHVDFRSDIFSLGATIFFMINGEKPFEGDDAATVYRNTLANSPPPHVRYEGRCSPECMFLIDRMMQRDPMMRYDSYDQLIAAIDQVMAQAPEQG